MDLLRYRLIRAEFIRRGLFLRDVSQYCGASRHQVYRVITGKSRVRSIAAQIEDLLGFRRGELFEYLRDENNQQI